MGSKEGEKRSPQVPLAKSPLRMGNEPSASGTWRKTRKNLKPDCLVAAARFATRFTTRSFHTALYTTVVFTAIVARS